MENNGVWDSYDNGHIGLLQDVHEGLMPQKQSQLCRGSYSYYHYTCDGTSDVGWGCGYRTLQTICSWILAQRLKTSVETAGKKSSVPSITDIQTALVEMGDKSQQFIKSRQWIGSFEVCLCLDYFYDVPCKILHVAKGSELQQHIPELLSHFESKGSPIMMGGETDNSSKGIMGVSNDPPAFLVVDPHYVKRENQQTSKANLQSLGWVRWVHLDELHADSFYNLCLPQLAAS